MPQFEYKVIPAPRKGQKAKGVRSGEARFAHALELTMNELAGEGWEYLRAEMLPSQERSGLASTTTEWRNVLVFRRLTENAAEHFVPELLPSPDKVQPVGRRSDTPVATRKEPGFSSAGLTARTDTPAEPARTKPEPEIAAAASSAADSITSADATDTPESSDSQTTGTLDDVDTMSAQNASGDDGKK